MQVFLIRHAEAIQETLALRDPHRHLTAGGRRQARAIGDRLRWHDCVPTHIWSSPLVRAIQTAELVAAALDYDAVIDALPALAPDENPRDVVAAVGAVGAVAAAGAGAAAGADAVIMLVGHEPGLSAVGALLIGQPEFASLAKAQAARIVDGALRWRFAWDADAPEIIARQDRVIG